MTDDKKNQPVVIEAPIIRSKDYGVIFSNQSRLRLGPTELAISFGYSDSLPTPGAPLHTSSNAVVEEKATIVLTPHHAKILALSLTGAIKAYEDEYGKIKLDQKPPVSLEKISKAIKEELDQAS